MESFATSTLLQSLFREMEITAGYKLSMLPVGLTDDEMLKEVKASQYVRKLMLQLADESTQQQKLAKE